MFGAPELGGAQCFCSELDWRLSHQISMAIEQQCSNSVAKTWDSQSLCGKNWHAVFPMFIWGKSVG